MQQRRLRVHAEQESWSLVLLVGESTPEAQWRCRMAVDDPQLTHARLATPILDVADEPERVPVTH
jgi:hypothetical protein